MAEPDRGAQSDNSDVRHEPRDVATSAVLWLGGSVVALGVVVTLGLWWLVRTFDAREKSRTESDLPLAVGERERGSLLAPAERLAEKLNHQPPLAGLPADGPVPGEGPWPLASSRTQARSESERLQQYGWVDRDKGIVHVPWDRATKLALENRDKYLRSRPREGGRP